MSFFFNLHSRTQISLPTDQKKLNRFLDGCKEVHAIDAAHAVDSAKRIAA
jgi:hypothetical protein